MADTESKKEVQEILDTLTGRIREHVAIVKDLTTARDNLAEVMKHTDHIAELEEMGSYDAWKEATALKKENMRLTNEGEEALKRVKKAQSALVLSSLGLGLCKCDDCEATRNKKADD